MSDLPTDLSAMLEAVEKYMGEQFAGMLDDAIARFRGEGWAAGCDNGYRIGYRVGTSAR